MGWEVTMNWRPRLDFGDRTLKLSLPQMPWTLRPIGVGGYRVSGAGVPASYQLRRDQRVEVTLRLTESELQGLFDFAAYAQSPPFSFYFWFDQSNATTRYVCYLESPQMGEGLQLNEQDGHIHTVTLTFRSANGTAFSPRYYANV
jgi:hypothetical protein